MSKEQVISIVFNSVPDVRIRVICDNDTKETKQAKIKYPFELHNTILVTVVTTYRTFSFNIYNGYTWNGADIPKFFYRVIGSRTSNEFLIASMLHDYLLEFKKYMLNEILYNQLTVNEYRRLTSLIFREKIKSQGTPTIKANIMSWCVDVFQMCNYKGWREVKACQ
jgi:hypothetical protein